MNSSTNITLSDWIKEYQPSKWEGNRVTTGMPTIQQITYGNDAYQVDSLKERMGLLEGAMIRWEERYQKKLKEHEETVDMLLEALKNATK